MTRCLKQAATPVATVTELKASAANIPITMSSTHFGFQTVDERDKAKRVRGVFDSVASNVLTKYIPLPNTTALQAAGVLRRLIACDDPNDALPPISGGVVTFLGVAGTLLAVDAQSILHSFDISSWTPIARGSITLPASGGKTPGTPDPSGRWQSLQNWA